ncbi:hypothetical protein [Baekduia sp.]|jgi:hypothetical protein|uniref:hypothetical protein n=1 Tax=Baekduia sp. TaxID=2600305 RepID=UPI002DFFCD31|nr:hypothetical protein [Baekduia sp.]
MKAQHHLIRLAAIAAGALAIVPATASAGIWAPVVSGTTANITAVDQVNASTLVYGTASGQILKNGSVKSTNPGFSINDIAFNPAGTIGLAAASNGRLLVSTNGGDSWAVKSLAATSYTQPTPCFGTPSPTRDFTPVGNINAVSWASNTVAYAIPADLGVVLKTTNSGTSWLDVSRQTDGTCFVSTDGDPLTDVKAFPGSDLVWFVADDFGTIYISSNGLASSAPHFDGGVNCFDHHPQLALDFDNPNRAFTVDRCDGSLQFGRTEDGGASWALRPDYFAGDGDTLSGLNDVAIAGGSALAVGNGGAILVDNDGRNAYFQRADGADATNDWLAADKLDATNAVIGGRGGRLLTTSQATTIPDIVAPAGTVTGATTVVAGTPATYTANVADNAGGSGSGIDPAGFAWSATGVPAASGNPATLTFPSPGFYLVSVSFKDLAGNAATASLTVNVTAPPVVKAPPPVNPVKTTTASVPGAKISFGVPNSCVKAGSTFKVTLTWKKQKRKGNKFVKVRRADFYIGSKRVKIDKKAPFTQTLKVKAGTKAGSTITVKARAYVKVTKGKSPTKSISSKIKVCS